MGLNLGNTNIGEIYLGNTKIAEAYLGSSKIYSATPPGPTFDNVTIGTQTWMSKNLTIDDGQGGIQIKTVNYGQGNVAEYYYTWDAAVRVANSISGWHLPTDAEWVTLANATGRVFSAGKKLKSTYGWSSGNGTDNYGFAVFPAGYVYGGSINNLNKNAYFWTANASSTTNATTRYFDTSNGISYNNYSKTEGHSVRLVKDET